MRKMHNTVPAWLFFALKESMEPLNRWTPEKETLAARILKGLTMHLTFHGLATGDIVEPNNHDNSKPYGNSTIK